MCDTVESSEVDILKLEYGLLGAYPDRVVPNFFPLSSRSCILGWFSRFPLA
jgi:hypothetical protein